MTVAFDTIPSNILVPGNYTESNSRRAASGATDLPKRVYLVGQRLATGATAAGVPFRIFSESDGDKNAGIGSMLGDMARVAKAKNRFVELWGIGLADGGSAVAATGSLAFTGPATATGVLYVYVGHYWANGTLRGRYAVKVTKDDSASVIATAVSAAITADPYRLVTATPTTGTIAVAARYPGISGNSIMLAHSFYDGESMPAGVGLTITQMTSGAVNPTLSTAIAAMGDKHFTHIAQPWTDATNMTAMETELTRRWGGTVQRELYHFSALGGNGGTLSACTTLGGARNSELSSIMGYGLSPTPPWIVAAEAAVADAGMDHPGAPVKGQRLFSVVAPKQGTEFQQDDREAILASGISTVQYNGSGECHMERLVSTNKTDANGTAQTIFRDRQVAGLLFALRHDWRTYIGAKYPDFMHAADGTPYAPGIKIVTPSTMRAEFEMRARKTWAYERGWIEDVEQFVADIYTERVTDGFDSIVAPNLVNCLHVNKTRFDFIR